MDDQPLPIAEHLTELDHRLRLSSSPDTGRLVLPPFLIRLRTASRLLAHADRMTRNPCFPALDRALSGFVGFVDENPGRIPRDLDGPLEFLAEVLESRLIDVDSGKSITSVAENPIWATVLARFQTTGSSRAIVRELEQLLDRWEEVTRKSALQPDESEVLHRSWLEARRRGDRLFEQPILASPVDKPGVLKIEGLAATCALLVDSPFQRDHLLQKIRAGGSSAIPLDNAEHAIRLAAESSGCLVLLGDNLEPSRNLERIVAKLSDETSFGSVRCILVSGGRPGQDVPHRRANALGAAGTWSSPFDLEDLQRTLDGESI